MMLNTSLGMCILYWQVWYSAQYAERMGASVFVNPELGKNQMITVHCKNVERVYMNIIFLTFKRVARSGGILGHVYRNARGIGKVCGASLKR